MGDKELWIEHRNHRGGAYEGRQEYGTPIADEGDGMADAMGLTFGVACIEVISFAY